MLRVLLAVTCLSMLLSARDVAAAAFDSAYTPLDFGQCTIVEANDFSVTRACPGYMGIPVMVSEDDARFFVSFGLDSTHEKAAEQTLAPFNTLGDTIEWRLTNASGAWMPFAAILRWFTDDGEGKKGEVLVVTRIAPENTCQIARIDVRKVEDANERARQIADARGLDFDCKSDGILTPAE